MKAWFDDPQQLIGLIRLNQFWPNRDQTPEDELMLLPVLSSMHACIQFISFAVIQEFLFWWHCFGCSLCVVQVKNG